MPSSHFTRSLGITLAVSVLFALGLLIPTSAHAATPTQVRDASALKPPPGVRVAIVEFGDMECPVCGNVNPVLRQAVNTYKIPWVRHDFPLPYHAWSFQAAVNARWFDSKSKTLGDEYRDQVFANQPSITTLAVLRQFTEKFANDHKVGPLPFAVDPQGTFTAAVNADKNLAQTTGVDHTPTIWIVVSPGHGAPYREVLDPNKLYQMIDQALADTKGK